MIWHSVVIAIKKVELYVLFPSSIPIHEVSSGNLAEKEEKEKNTEQSIRDRHFSPGKKPHKEKKEELI